MMEDIITAPKDPEKPRAYFYIMRGKEVFGAKQPDGRGIQFIYENDGRLINSAQIVGNITDSTILNLLETTEGFRKLVHSIGISVETDNMDEEVEFVFQMYGKRDVYGGGTNLRCKLTGDGLEGRIKLEEIDWWEEDDIPGQIRFEFATPELLAKVNVRLYLNDGYEAPEIIDEEEIDYHSANYKTMIERSLMQLGGTKRIKEAIMKARRGEDVTLAYIGGSITQGAGATPINTECYAYKSYKAFADKYGTGGNVHFVKAGVGGTPSELGMIRFDRDILRAGTVQPDIVVIEFAVNDEGDETKGDCYESLVRKILMLPNKPAIVLLFSVFANDWNLQDRLSPVGQLYNLPMVSVLDAVSPQFKLMKEEGRVLSKNQYFYDVFHPNNTGHTIMADCLTWMFTKAEELIDIVEEDNGDTYIDELLKQSPVIGKSFENIKLLDRREHPDGIEIRYGMFSDTDTDLQCVEMDMDLIGTPEFPYNWFYSGNQQMTNKNGSYEMKIICKSLLLIFKDSGATDFGAADVFVDDTFVLTADPKKNGWVHCNPVIILQDQESKEHLVRVQMASGDEDKKFTILGWGYVE